MANQMTKAASAKDSKTGRSYRGVTLQPPATLSKTPLVRLQKAVEAAVAKNAHALSRKK